MPDPARSPAHLQTSDRARSLRSSRAPSSRLHDDDDDYASSRSTRRRDAATWNASVAALLSSSNAQQPKSPASQPASPSPSLNTASPDAPALAASPAAASPAAASPAAASPDAASPAAASPDAASPAAASPDAASPAAASPATADLDTAASPDRDPQADDPPPLDYQPIDSSIASRFHQCTGENVSHVLIAENPDLLQQGKRGVAIEGRCIEVIPGSLQDLALCAHELTHIVQQRGPSQHHDQPPFSHVEDEALAAEKAISNGKSFSISLKSSEHKLFNDEKCADPNAHPTFRHSVTGRITLVEPQIFKIKITPNQGSKDIADEDRIYSNANVDVTITLSSGQKFIAKLVDNNFKSNTFAIEPPKDLYEFMNSNPNFPKHITFSLSGSTAEIRATLDEDTIKTLKPLCSKSNAIAHSNTPNASPSPSNPTSTNPQNQQPPLISDQKSPTQTTTLSQSHTLNSDSNDSLPISLSGSLAGEQKPSKQERIQHIIRETRKISLASQSADETTKQKSKDLISQSNRIVMAFNTSQDSVSDSEILAIEEKILEIKKDLFKEKEDQTKPKAYSIIEGEVGIIGQYNPASKNLEISAIFAPRRGEEMLLKIIGRCEDDGYEVRSVSGELAGKNKEAVDKQQEPPTLKHLKRMGFSEIENHGNGRYTVKKKGQ